LSSFDGDEAPDNSCGLAGRRRLTDGTVVYYGLLGRHLVVTAGKNFVTDAWQDGVELENMRYHGIGTGTTAAAAGDTALQTELSTAYNPDNTAGDRLVTEAPAPTSSARSGRTRSTPPRR
jgi:hypothetical protein